LEKDLFLMHFVVCLFTLNNRKIKHQLAFWQAKFMVFLISVTVVSNIDSC